MIGILMTLGLGVAYAVDSISKSCRDESARAEAVAEGKPYYPTSDNNYVYIPTGEKCYITTERIDTMGSYKTVLRTISKGDKHPSRIVYVFPGKSREEKKAEFEEYYHDALRKYGIEK